MQVYFIHEKRYFILRKQNKNSHLEQPGSSKTKWHPPSEQTATFPLHQQVSGKLSVWGSAAVKVSWSHDWHRLLPSALSHSRTSSPHPLLLWHIKELSGNRWQPPPQKKTKPTKIKFSNNYCIVAGLLFICMHIYEKLILQIHLFLFILLPQFPKQTQRLLWHSILKQKSLHFHIKQF